MISVLLEDIGYELNVEFVRNLVCAVMPFIFICLSLPLPLVLSL